MTTCVLTSIQKHITKISRILNSLCEEHPQISQKIDLALYSTIKIQKLVKKQLQQSKSQQKDELIFKNTNCESNLTLNEEDQLYQNALNVIQGFKTATKKLQNKVGVLLRQQEIMKNVQRAKRYMNPNNQTQPFYNYYDNNRNRSRKQNMSRIQTRPNLSPYQQSSPFSPHVASSGSKGKHYEKSSRNNTSVKQKLKIQKYMNESQSFDQIQEVNKSKNISELDQQIIQLASKIKHVLKEGQ